MGWSAGDFLRGDDLFYPDVLGLTTNTRELTAGSNAEYRLADADLVFAGHHDYVYLYFDAGKGAAPSIHRSIEADGAPEWAWVFDVRSAWLEASVDDEVVLAEG